MDSRAAEALIKEHTVVVPPVLCPEMKLHLITHDCELWTADEKKLIALGIEEPFWGFAWPGGQALARYIYDHPEVVKGQTILDMGAGGGICAIAAAMCGAERVLAVDIDEVAGVTCGLNAALNQVDIQFSSFNYLEEPQIVEEELILVGDVCYGSALTEPLMKWLKLLAQAGKKVLVADPRRGFLDAQGLANIALYEAPQDIDVEGRYRVTTAIYQIPA